MHLRQLELHLIAKNKNRAYSKLTIDWLIFIEKVLHEITYKLYCFSTFGVESGESYLLKEKGIK